MKYFQGCKTLAEARIKYRHLLLQNHPDALKRITQEIIEEWRKVKADVREDGTLPEHYQEAGATRESPEENRVVVNSDKYFVYKGIQFRPPLNQREVDFYIP